MASITTLNLTDTVTRLRKPWEVVDVEISPHLSMEMVFDNLKGLKRDGRYFQACCPFHEGEERDVFSIDPERLEWICFLGCGGGGPVQYLQKARNLTWLESAQTLAVMAGIDPSKLNLWGQHWNEADFERHAQLEIRSALLRIFVAYSRTLMMSPAGRTLRRHLNEKYQLTETALEELELGLFTTNTDVFHYLKRTGQDLTELRSKGLFETKWNGRLVAPWKDISGRTVNLWGWDCNQVDGEGGLGEVLFERDPLGAQQTPFLLSRAVAASQTDLLLLDQPLSALLILAAGIKDPFPVASMGNLTSEQADLLDQVLAGEGSLTLLSDYRPDSYGTRSETTLRHSKVLAKAAFPVFAVDSRLMAEDNDKAAAPHMYLLKQGKEGFQQLVQQAEVLISPARKAIPRGALLPGLTQVFKRGASRSSRAQSEDNPLGNESGGALLSFLLGAAEEIGQRIAQGFLRNLPGAGAEGLPPAVGGSVQAQLPPASQPPPAVFSVDRLEQESRQASLTKPSGFEALDELGVRFRPEEFVLVGAGSGSGRTTFLVGLLVYWLYRTEENFVFFSFDESEAQIYHRMLSLLTAVAGQGWPVHQVRNHLTRGVEDSRRVTVDELQVLETARECLRGWENRLHIVFCGNTTLVGVQRYLAEMSQSSTLGAVFIDSIDSLVSSGNGQQTARALKALAVEHTCPLVSTVQTQAPPIAEEALESQGDPSTESELSLRMQQLRPRLPNFPPGLDQDADLILGLLNHVAVNPHLTGVEISELTPFEVGILKNRSGPQGDWTSLTLDRRFCLLQDCATPEPT